MKKTKGKIFSEKLESVISALMFKPEYKDIIAKEMKNKHGIYALYNKEKLYYVGLASKDVLDRLKRHYKGKHKGKWDRFSIYFTKKKQYVYGLEDAFISVAKPPGNDNNPLKIPSMEERITKAIKKRQSENLQDWMGRTQTNTRRNNRLKKRKKKRKSGFLKNYFENNRPLMKEYNGKIYRATLLKSGKIKYKKKSYDSPTSAALAVVHRKTVNGPDFWSVKVDENNWVKLKELK